MLSGYEKELEIHKIGIKHRDIRSEILTKPCQKKDKVIEETKDSIVQNISMKSESEILSRLREIGPQKFVSSNSNPNWSPHFDVFQSDTSKFRKTTVQSPNFRIIVCNSSEPVPKFTELSENLNQFSDNVGLILAIVYPDFINFLQIKPVSLPLLI